MCPSPGRAERGSAWGGTARCGCCNTQSSAAPPHRAATPRSWHWCCPPCCGRFQRPPLVSCTLQGQLSLLLLEHLQKAKRETGDEMGFAAVTNTLQPPLLQVKNPTWLSHAQAYTHTHVLSLSSTPPALSLYRAMPCGGSPCTMMPLTAAQADDDTLEQTSTTGI